MSPWFSKPAETVPFRRSTVPKFTSVPVPPRVPLSTNSLAPAWIKESAAMFKVALEMLKFS
jgi:hypothetical protein